MRKQLTNTKYTTGNGTEIEPNSHVRDIGVIMSNDCEFSEHYKQKIAIARKIIGLIWRSFKTRKAKVMLKLSKSFVLPIIVVLVTPSKKEEIVDIERLQRKFTSKIEEVKHLNYWDRLKELKLYSLQRRRERCTIIYIWKILEHMVPNFDINPVTSYCRGRQGRMCHIPKIKGEGRIKTLREEFIAVKGARLFNILPMEIRRLQNVSLERFKAAFDSYLSEIADKLL